MITALVSFFLWASLPRAGNPSGDHASPVAASRSGPVSPVDPCKSEPQPSDPTGTYLGEVNLEFFYNGSFMQYQQSGWTVRVAKVGCSGCAPGSIGIAGTLAATYYDSGFRESASFTAFVDQTGTLSSVAFQGDGCAVSNALSSPVFYAGEEGPEPGSPLRLSDHRIAGRISGMSCGDVVEYVDIDLPLAPDPSCADLSGRWLFAYSNSCGQSGNGIAAYVTQEGCIFSAAVPTQGNVVGTIDSSGGVSGKITSFDPCYGSGTFFGTASNAEASGSYSGHTSCAQCDPISGTFTLIRQ